MLKSILKSLFLLSLISTSLSADSLSSYNDVFQELSTTPVSQLDFRIYQLNDAIRNFRKTVHAEYIDVEWNDWVCSYTAILRMCDEVSCYKDPTNPNIVVCEVISDIRQVIETKKKIKKSQYIHDTILNLAKTIIHPSFNQANLRVIIKRQKLVNPLIVDHLPQTEDFDDFLFSHIQQQETLVIWENGIPHYQDAFYSDYSKMIRVDEFIIVK